MPSTLKQTVDRVKAAKTEIANAITTKGGTVGATDGLEEFSNDIMSIKTDTTSIDITANGTYNINEGEKTVTTTSFPIIISDSVGPINHIDILGNISQSGSPSSANPIYPQETGDKTANLFDKNTITPDKYVTTDGENSSTNYYCSDYIPVSEGAYYLANVVGSNFQQGYVVYDSNKQAIRQGTISGAKVASGVVNISANEYYIRINMYIETSPNVVMVNPGSTALPYEPFGYKIPISSGGTTTPVYLGQVQSTRQIRQLVLTGKENWVHTAGTSSESSYYRCQIGSLNSIITSNLELCTHFVHNTIASTTTGVGFCVQNSTTANADFLAIRPYSYNPPSELSTFKQFLAQKYANGTPVTVWCVLATPETSTLNEPIRKIGDYTDEINADISIPLSSLEQNTIDITTSLKPSSASFTYRIGNTYMGFNEVNVNVPNTYAAGDEGKVVSDGALVSQTSSSTSSNGTVDTTLINSLNVDVPNTYSAGDEGKVVNNATLIPQTSMPAEITVNGTYDTTLYNSIAVNVPDIVGHTFIVATIPNAIVTVTNASNTYTETADNVGEALFKSVAAGTYNVTATYDDAVSDTTTVTIADHAVTEDSFATLTISASDNTTITVTDGTVVKTLTYTGTPIVQYVSLGSWDLSCTIDDTVITRTILVDSYTNQNIRLAPPSQSISRYVDFTTNTTTITGVPDTHPVYMGINRCNVSDNGAINAYYGDASYVEDGSNGQVMVKIPKFYYKVTPDENGGLDGVNIRKCTWEISDTPDTGFALHPAFYDANGNEIDYFLYGAFDGVGQRDSTYGTSYNTSADKLSSVAGSSYLPTNSLTRATARTMATNRGTGWYSAGVKQTMAVLMLFVVEHGFNSQIAVGQGVVSASAATYAGQTTGNITSGTQDNKTTPVNWRGIENLWGNIWDWIDGLNVNGMVPYFCNTYTFVDDTSTGYTQIAFSLPSSNYITAFGYDSTNDWVLLPSESSSTAKPTGPIGDYVFSYSGWRVALLGGRWSDVSDAGAFFWICHFNSSDANVYLGARLMFIPTAA